MDADWLIKNFKWRRNFTIFPSSLIIGFIFPFIIFQIWVVTTSIELAKISVITGNIFYFLIFIVILISVIFIINLPAFFIEKTVTNTKEKT